MLSRFSPLLLTTLLLGMLLSLVQVQGQAQDNGPPPQESLDPQRSPVESPPKTEAPFDEGPSKRDLRQEGRRQRIQQVGLQWGLPLELSIPLIIGNGLTAFRPELLLGIHLKTQSDYRYAYTDLDFALGLSLRYQPPPAYAMQRLTNHQLFRIGPKLGTTKSKKQPSRYRGLRFYVGGGLQMSHYSVHTDLSGTSTAYLDLRAIASLALIYNVGSVSSLEAFAREPRSPNATYRRGYKKNIYHSWGLIFDIFSVGIGDHSEQNIFQDSSLLVADIFAAEFFYARLFLKENQGNRSSSHQWTYRWRLSGHLISDNPFQAGFLTVSFESIISYSWRWSWRQY